MGSSDTAIIVALISALGTIGAALIGKERRAAREDRELAERSEHTRETRLRLECEVSCGARALHCSSWPSCLDRDDATTRSAATDGASDDSP